METWRRAVQLCPDWHPAVGSMALWGTIQNYPACPVGPRFADELMPVYTNTLKIAVKHTKGPGLTFYSFVHHFEKSVKPHLIRPDFLMNAINLWSTWVYGVYSKSGPLLKDALKLLDDAWAKTMSLVPLYGKRHRSMVVLHSWTIFYSWSMIVMK